MRKKVDDRIRTLIENGVKLRHRSMFLIVGDKSRDQVLFVIPDSVWIWVYLWVKICAFEVLIEFSGVGMQIVNLHYMLSKSVVKSRPTVLWCYKDKLELSRFFILNSSLQLISLSFLWLGRGKILTFCYVTWKVFQRMRKLSKQYALRFNNL